MNQKPANRMTRILLCVFAAFFITAVLPSCSNNGDGGVINRLEPVIFSQVYGTGNSSGSAVRYSYIQLYNTSDETLNLAGASLYVKSGKNKEFTEYPFPKDEYITAGHYYLIRGAEVEERSVVSNSESEEILRVDYFDLELDKLALDNHENVILLGRSGLGKHELEDYAMSDNVYTCFIGTEEDSASLGEIHTAGDMSKSKVAVKIGNRADSYYAVYNLTKLPVSDLIGIRPQTSEGDVNTYVNSCFTEVEFSHYAGFYNEEFELTLTAPEGYTIYYTTDGSAPTVESEVYSSPMLIKDTSAVAWGPEIDRGIRYLGDGARPTKNKMLGSVVIKAMASNGIDSTDVYTNTYFVIPDFADEYDVTVFSFSMAERDWISGVGFYNRFGASDPRPRSKGYLEVFDNDGNRVGHSNIEVGVSGKYSASKLMKSLRIYYKGSLNDGTEGQSKLRYDLFGEYAKDANGGVISEFERLLLRNGGNDCGISYIRDAFSQRLGGLLGIDEMAYTPALVFINGEFWGMYNCRERYETQYITSHYGVAEENVTVMESDYSLVNRNNLADYVVSDGNIADGANFNELYHYIVDADLSDPEVYEYVYDRLDVDSVIDMYVEHLILGAADWPFNNIKLWRNSNPDDPSGVDTKWHYALLDQDTTLGLSRSYTSGSGFNEAFNYDSVTACIMMGLMENESFRNRFYLRYYEAATEIYTVENMTELFWEVYDSVKPLIELQEIRWPGDGANSDTWEQQMNVILTFIQNRPTYALDNLYDFFDIDEEYILSLKQTEITEQEGLENE